MDKKRYIITIDGGTTNTRVYLWTTDGIKVDGRSGKIGGRDTAISGDDQEMKKAVREMIASLMDDDKISCEDIEAVYASGMITSDVGLYELEHLTAPVGIGELAAGVRTVVLDDICPKPICFIPGVKNRESDQIALDDLMEMDMMRGEETEALAILAEAEVKGRAILILPGSHTKIIAVDEKRRIAGCLTSMTGELLDMLTNHSIIADAVGRAYLHGSPDERYLWAGYDQVRKTGSFGRTAFLVRICSRFVSNDSKKCASFLLGAVLESDVAAIKSSRLMQETGMENAIIAGKDPLASSLAYLMERDGGFKMVSIFHGKDRAPLSGKGALLIHKERDKRDDIVRGDRAK